MQQLDDAIINYVTQYSSPESEVLKFVHRQTHLKALMAGMSSDPLQGRFLSFVSKLLRPKSILEIGTFTAYATLCLAEGLHPDGKLYTIEKRKELEFLIAPHIALSEQAVQINSLFGDAESVIASLDMSFDFIFLDGAKLQYLDNYKQLFDKWESGGVMIVDNVLWYGNVVPPHADETTAAIHEFNAYIRRDDRVESFILPYRDGLNILRKK